jgi:hypothetical protein
MHGLGDVVLVELEMSLAEKVLNVLCVTCGEVIQADHAVACPDQVVAQMRPNKPGSSSDQDPLARAHDLSSRTNCDGTETRIAERSMKGLAGVQAMFAPIASESASVYEG